MQTGDMRYIYQNKLQKACSQHDMTYGSYKDLVKKTESNKVLRYKAFKIVVDSRHDGYQRFLNFLVNISLFRFSTSGSVIKNKFIPRQE